MCASLSCMILCSSQSSLIFYTLVNFRFRRYKKKTKKLFCNLKCTLHDSFAIIPCRVLTNKKLAEFIAGTRTCLAW